MKQFQMSLDRFNIQAKMGLRDVRWLKAVLWWNEIKKKSLRFGYPL